MKRARLLLLALLPALAGAAPVEVPRGVNHEPYDRLLKKYVNDRGLVNYRAWKGNVDDLKALREYTAQFAAEGQSADVASLINSYNALTIRWILDNYPVKSIKTTDNPWKAKRHRVGGREVSLDEIEHDTLRPLVGYRVHAVLVCAAKSCPPLRAGAYTAGKLDQQLDDAMRRWLSREDLNRLVPAEKRMELSKIFSWYGKDFGDVRVVLEKYSPTKCPDCEISYQPYDWSLNEQ